MVEKNACEQNRAIQPASQPASVYMNIYNFVFFSIQDIKNPLSG